MVVRRACQAMAAALMASVLMAACGPLPPGTSGAVAPGRGPQGSLLREDRVSITRGTVVRGVGVTRRWVYATTDEAVLVYDRALRRWLPPFTREGGFDPALVRRVAVDPDDESAWLLTATGAWTLQPLTAFLSRAPGGSLPSRLRAETLASVYQAYPSLQSFGGLLTRDPASLQTYPAIAGARAPDRSEVWFGTGGGGLYQVDPLFNSAEVRPFGLAATGAGAMARAADGVWIAPAPRGIEPRQAITFASRDLQRFRWVDDESRRALGGGRATALDAYERTLWLGSTNGLFRIATEGGAVRAFTPMSGLPSDLVLSVLARSDGVWVGTSRGLAFLGADSADARGVAISQSAVADVGVRALLATGDTLWVGTDAGLVLRTPGTDGRFVRPAESPVSPRLRQPVMALARADSVVFVALRDGVMSFNLKRGTWLDAWPATAWRTVGEITVAAADARSLWVGGALGVLTVDRSTGVSRALRAGSDLPEGVTGLLLDGPWAWIATLGGVVRVRRASDGLIP